jgi:predicted RNase H-related nuclease YkuK (DUF458 family)
MTADISGPFTQAEAGIIFALTQHPGYAALMEKLKRMRAEKVNKLIKLDIGTEKTGSLKGQVALIDEILGWPKGLEKQINPNSEEKT